MSDRIPLPEEPAVPMQDAAETPQPETPQTPPEEPIVPTQDTAETPQTEAVQAPPEEPDILIQDLDNLPQACAPQAEEAGSRCVRCDKIVPEGEHFCAECLETMDAYPVSVGTWIGAVLGVLVSLFALFVLCVNLLIANPVVKGDDALEAGDLRACYTSYGESYNVAKRLNDLLFPGSKLSFFTNGAHTLEKQIVALDKLNGPYQAGKVIESYYGEKPPKSLKSTYAQYKDISAFVTEMQARISEYRGSLGAGDAGDYDAMIALVDDAEEKLPKTPDYMAQYYRFSVSYSLADDPARTCGLLDKLIEMEPDALWLYASEGIRAYDLGEEYEKALDICNRLMQRDASDPATVAYTMAQLRLLRRYDDAIAVYESALKLTEPSSEMQRQLAIIWMLEGDYDKAQQRLVDSFSPATATLEHMATIALCAFANGDDAVYMEYKMQLDSYVPYEQVDLFAAGECTLEDIFLSGGGEVK